MADKKGRGPMIPIAFTQGADPKDIAEAVCAFVNKRKMEKEDKEKEENPAK